MAKQKTRIMWWSRDSEGDGWYSLFKKEPDIHDAGKWLEAKNLVRYQHPREIRTLTPNLKLRKGQCVKVKVTTLKHGYKMEKENDE